MSRIETKGERKRTTTTTTKQNTSNNSYMYLVEEVTPQILSLGAKPFLIFFGCVI